jgi:uncharacterized protein (TIGR04141 family)
MAKKTLSLHLAKPDITEFGDLLSESAKDRLRFESTQIIDAKDFADGARLYTFSGDEKSPDWFKDVRQIIDVPKSITNQSSCGVLIFKVQDRFFASTFAHGWMYLDEECVEGDFGLRVALNALDEKRLKRLERANLGDALQQVSQSPFQRDFTSFGLDDSLDLIRRLSGRTREESSAHSLSGSRSLKVSGDFDLSDLPRIASEALEFYSSTFYKESTFQIVDLVSPITDARLISNLDTEAARSIRELEENFELGLPITYSDDGASYHFKGPGSRGSYPDLVMTHYVEALGTELVNCDPETLRKHKIEARLSDDMPPVSWSIRSALVGSMEYKNGRYAANEGEWYRIDESFRNSIETKFLSLVQGWETQPIRLKKIYDESGRHGRFQSEASFNKDWADNSNLLLLDTHLIGIPDIQRSNFEPCDLLDPEGKRFIHVKKSSRRSNVLSHFFKQGSNSAQQFQRFPAAWEQLFILVEKLHGAEAAQRVKAANEDKGRKWKVDFVIADAPRASGNFDIPFFSKISLRDESISLNAMTYDVAVKFIGLELDPLH